MKILIYLIVVAVVVGGAVLLLGRAGQAPESSVELAQNRVSEEVPSPADEALPEAEEAEEFPPTKLYNARGFLDCGYFWNDVRAACPEVKKTKWNSADPWDINAFPTTCKMRALGSAEGEFLIHVSRVTGKGDQSAEEVFHTGRAGFATIGYKTIDVAGLGEKAYTVPNPYSDVQTGYNFNVKKGVWLVDITSSNPSFCTTEERAKDVVQRILKKLP